MSLDLVQLLVKSGRGGKNKLLWLQLVWLKKKNTVYSLVDSSVYAQLETSCHNAKIQILHKSQLYTKCSYMFYVPFKLY